MASRLHDMPSLFVQLGLPNDEASMQQFLASHYLDDAVKLQNAAFFNARQAAFIQQAYATDNDWLECIEQLNRRLRSVQ